MLQQILSFIFMICLTFSSLFGMPVRGYESKQLFADAGFENGFVVMSQETADGAGVSLGEFTYGGVESPSWMIAQWNSGPCLWQERAESDVYTLTDGKTKTVMYNPIEKSISMRLNAANIYNGEPASFDAWPHLLLEQSPLCDYSSLSEKDKAFYSCDADRMVLDLNIRMTDFVDTTNSEGVNAVQYLAYFYLKDEEKHRFIWFGVDLFDNRGYNDTSWANDKASGNMIYCLSTKDTYGKKYKSLFRNGRPYISQDWVNVHIDLKPHILKVFEKANKENLYGEKIYPEDFFVGGTNIGFEIHGNYDCTVEIKGFALTAYNKK
ncbi:MAG: hypothetical protein J6A67_03555 [Clostridia bacterium]|nr:hypothetical protein [Clostridia bacterium]